MGGVGALVFTLIGHSQGSAVWGRISTWLGRRTWSKTLAVLHNHVIQLGWIVLDRFDSWGSSACIEELVVMFSCLRHLGLCTLDLAALL